MNKNTIVCLIGASCSGKSTVIQELIKKYTNINYIESFTTRAKRFDNETGHHFVTKAEYLTQKRTEDLFCANEYLGNYYWMKKSQYRGKGLSIFPLEPNGLKNIRQEVTDATIVAIYFSVTEENLRKRLYDRNKITKTLDIEHIIETDKKLFMNNNDLNQLINFTVDGDVSIEYTVNSVIKIINQFYSLKEDY